MTINWQWIGRYVLARFCEASTWTGLIKFIVGATGWSLSETQATAIVSAGIALAGLVSIMLPDKMNKPQE